MDSVLERLREKKDEIKANIFIRLEVEDNKKIYHTKVMNDFYAFGIDNRYKGRFFISFRGLFNQKKIMSFNLFSIKGDDKFLGIFYGYKKPIRNIIKKYEENGIIKTSFFSKIYYIEFRFRKGSVFCYIKGIHRLLQKDRFKTKYCQVLVEKLSKLEREVHLFYNKKLPKGGLVHRWIKKNQR
ncbi:Putative cytosolic protein (plasmid) [Borrelia crocidurae DOU]|uniref:Putative cytosolic protein n=1 Tax=Borrelia crocidurae DOU TaxID=1293575 RepID=W5SK94_9SPIR|nr:DUF226 domain-containing protein [Borrelia crocidurae]AHH07564.1 Putative cytosolic protein [Borrelia crocidurae DOU]